MVSTIGGVCIAGLLLSCCMVIAMRRMGGKVRMEVTSITSLTVSHQHHRFQERVSTMVRQMSRSMSMSQNRMSTMARRSTGESRVGKDYLTVFC